MGSLLAFRFDRKFVGIEKNKEFFEMAVARIRKEIEKKS